MKPRAAPGLVAKARHTLGGPSSNRMVKSIRFCRNTGPAQPSGACRSGWISCGMAPKITPSRRTSSRASFSAREMHTTVRPGRQSSRRLASARASQVMPSWRAFSTITRRFSAMASSAGRWAGHSRKGCSRVWASGHSMCTYRST